MRCGKNRTLFDSLPARQITRAGFACMEMIHGFKEGWIIWHRAGPPARVKPYQWKRALKQITSRDKFNINESNTNTSMFLLEHCVPFNPFNPEFTIVIFIHYKPRIAGAILDL